VFNYLESSVFFCFVFHFLKSSFCAKYEVSTQQTCVTKYARVKCLNLEKKSEQKYILNINIWKKFEITLLSGKLNDLILFKIKICK